VLTTKLMMVMVVDLAEAVVKAEVVVLALPIKVLLVVMVLLELVQVAEVLLRLVRTESLVHQELVEMAAMV